VTGAALIKFGELHLHAPFAPTDWEAALVLALPLAMNVLQYVAQSRSLAQEQETEDKSVGVFSLFRI
jgi:hypothetical protein